MHPRLLLLIRLIATQAVLFGAAANPAWARHHHHAAALSQGHTGGEQQGNAGNSTVNGSKDTQKNERVSGTGEPSGKGNPLPKGAPDANPGVKAGGIPGSGDHGGSEHTGFGSGPIDTSITVVGSPKSKRSTWTQIWKKAKLAKTANSTGQAHNFHSSSNHAGKQKFVTNAVGLSVPQKNPDPKATGVKVSTSPDASFMPKNAGPVGAAGGFVPLPPSLTRPHDPPVKTAAVPMSINGRSMIRPGSNVGVIGGPNRMAGGVINGADFHPKVP
jgi:hypothetical protein